MTITFDTMPSDQLLTGPSAVMWSVWRSGCYLTEGNSVRFQKSKAASSDQKGDISGTGGSLATNPRTSKHQRSRKSVRDINNGWSKSYSWDWKDDETALWMEKWRLLRGTKHERHSVKTNSESPSAKEWDELKNSVLTVLLQFCTVMEKQKKVNSVTSEALQLHWADLKPVKAPFIPWKHDLRHSSIFSGIRK